MIDWQEQIIRDVFGTLKPKSMDTLRADVKSGLAPATPIEPTTTKKYYRVQLGAFSVKANADAMLSKVKVAGFTDAFVKYGK